MKRASGGVDAERKAPTQRRLLQIGETDYLIDEGTNALRQRLADGAFSPPVGHFDPTSGSLVLDELSVGQCASLVLG